MQSCFESRPPNEPGTRPRGGRLAAFGRARTNPVCKRHRWRAAGVKPQSDGQVFYEPVCLKPTTFANKMQQINAAPCSLSKTHFPNDQIKSNQNSLIIISCINVLVPLRDISYYRTATLLSLTRSPTYCNSSLRDLQHLTDPLE